MGNLSENLWPGVGNLSIFLEAVNVVPFSIFSLKNMRNWMALYISIKNTFSNFALNRYVWFSLHHFPIPQYFLHPSRKLPAAIEEEKQLMYRLKS